FVPAGQTEFARDSAFGYQSSRMQDWTEEKTGGQVRANQVGFIGVDDLRQGGPGRAAELLAAVHGRRTIVVNAASYRDLEVLVLGLLQAEAAGKRFLYRTAASFVRVRVGQSAPPRLSYGELYPDGPASSAGGLVVVGSHVSRT